jgi:hypothetical protein
MENFFEGYSSDEVESAKGKIKHIETRRKEYKIVKEKLEKEFNFKIVNYIIDDILDYETYHHICLMINMAVVNCRLSAEQGEMVKTRIKKIFKVNNEYDRVDKTVYTGEIMDFDKWYENYSTEEIIELKNQLSPKDLDILKKLNIEIKGKVYTEQEFEYLDMSLLAYYIAEDMDEEELKESKPLPENVSREEYNNLLEKMNKISENYNF